HRVVGRVTGEDLATEGWVGGVAVAGHRVGTAGWLSLARGVVVAGAVDVHIAGVDALHHLGQSREERHRVLERRAWVGPGDRAGEGLAGGVAGPRRVV